MLIKWPQIDEVDALYDVPRQLINKIISYFNKAGSKQMFWRSTKDNFSFSVIEWSYTYNTFK